MKTGIHPEWFPEAKMVCISCGTEWTVGSTMPENRIDICSNCHPFYTGEQRIVDTEGQVDRFLKRLQHRDRMAAEAKGREEEPLPMETSIEFFELGKRYSSILEENGLDEVGKVVDLLQEEGDEGLLKFQGIGRKVLADVKKKLRMSGIELPESEE